MKSKNKTKKATFMRCELGGVIDVKLREHCGVGIRPAN